MIRRPPRSTQSRSSAASDVYKRQFTNWAKTRGIKPGEMVYFGDTISQDLKATRDFSPSLDFVGVVSGINTREEFLDAGVPLCRIVDFGKLPNFLHNIIREKVET